MKFAKALMIGAVLAGGAAFAQEEMEPTDPNAIAREELMKSQGMNIGILAARPALGRARDQTLGLTGRGTSTRGGR